MKRSRSKIALVLVALFGPLVAFAQQGMPMGRDGMMWCPPYGAGGTVLTVLAALLLLAATAALIAFTFFLLQRSRPRAPMDT